MANVTTPKFRVSYPKVFKPEVNKLSGKTEYSVVALFDKGADLSALKAAAKQAVIDKWGPDPAKHPKNLKSPFRDQAEKAKEVDGKRILPAGHTEGAIFMNLKSTQRPGVVDQNVQPILDESTFYAGCYARASVSCYAYDQAGNRGVSFGLSNIQKMAEGEPFSGRPSAEEAFSPVTSESGTTASSVNDLF